MPLLFIPIRFENSGSYGREKTAKLKPDQYILIPFWVFQFFSSVSEAGRFVEQRQAVLSVKLKEGRFVEQRQAVLSVKLKEGRFVEQRQAVLSVKLVVSEEGRFVEQLAAPNGGFSGGTNRDDIHGHT